MELDIDFINKELKNIVNNKKIYTNDIILHALATIELITITKQTNLISYKFIQFLNYLKQYIKCYIDFDFLLYAYNNKKNIIIKENGLSTSTSSFSSNSSGESNQDLNDKIDKMLKNESILLNEIVKDNVILKKDDYGDIDKKVLKLSKRLFNILDIDNDGYISALDALHIIEITKKYPLLFENNFDDTLIYLLTSENYNKINFDVFFMNLL